VPVVRSFALPDVGEGLTEAEILRWDVGVGDAVEVNTVLVEIETAKASVELPSPYAGTITAIHVDEGAIVPVGTVLISVEVDDGQAPAEPAEHVAAPVAEPAERPTAVLVGYGVATGPTRRRRRSGPGHTPVRALAAPTGLRPRAKPPVRRLARELGVDLAGLVATGPNGVVSRADVMAAHAATTAPAGERIAVRGVRRAMAAAMVASATTAPQASVWVEVDLTAALARLELARSAPVAAGVRITALALVAQALLRAGREQPLLHSAWHDQPDGPVLVVPEHLGLGIATDTARGLLVPVVADPPVDDLVELAGRIQRAVDSARSGAATPRDLTGGTVTITNVGVLGVDGGIPILTPGQSVIVAMGRALDRPWVVDGAVVARPVMQVTLTFDHRVLDGAQAASVLARVAAELGRADPD